MKRSIILGITISLFTLLVGCRIEQETRVKSSQLYKAPTEIDSTVKIEVSSCTHYEDKTKPSNDLVKIQDVVAKLFPDSMYEGCNMENFNSMATFTIPISVGEMPPDGKEPVIEGLALLKNKAGETFFFVSKAAKMQIEEAKKNAMSGKFEPQVNIRLANNGKENLYVFPYAVYFNDEPCSFLERWKNHYVVEPTKTAKIKLSDVSADFAITKGAVPVFSLFMETQINKANNKEQDSK